MLILLPLTIAAQQTIQRPERKTKTVDLCVGPGGLFHVAAQISLVDNYPTDTLFVVTGRNSQYTQLTDYLLIKSGTFDQVHGFFTYCKGVLETEDSGISLRYDGNGIAVTKVRDTKGLWIDGEGEDDRGYTGFNMRAIDKVLSCMKGWK